MKKAILYGLFGWMAIFVEVSVIGFTPGLAIQGQNGFTLLPPGIAIHFCLLVLLSAILAFFYFKNSKAGMVEGAKVGSIVILTGFVLDSLITIPYFVKSYSLFFTKWTLWVGVLLVIGTFSFVAKWKKDKI
jgi:hypothetical protein